MKKLTTLLVMLLFTAGMAIGQNNEATVEQTGNDNEADVTQVGNINEAEVTQFGSNTSIVNQNGVDNEARVMQGEDGDPVTNLDTGSWRYGAFIDQTGDENEAEIVLYKGDGTYQSGGSSNGARIEQDGDGNEAFQEISNSQVKTSDWNRMGAHIKQLGDDNFAQQQVFRSFGTHGSGGILIDQNGSENDARQYVIGGRNNTTEVYQNGDGNNFVGFTDSDVADILNLSWNQKPAEDFAQYQRGEYSTVSIDITGNDNITAQYQESTTWGGGNNSATMLISGDSNEAAQAQLGEYNTAEITMSGNYNLAGIQQLGVGHDATINQTGNSNSSYINQSPL